MSHIPVTGMQYLRQLISKEERVILAHSFKDLSPRPASVHSQRQSMASLRLWSESIHSQPQSTVSVSPWSESVQGQSQSNVRVRKRSE